MVAPGSVKTWAQKKQTVNLFGFICNCEFWAFYQQNKIVPHKRPPVKFMYFQRNNEESGCFHGYCQTKEMKFYFFYHSARFHNEKKINLTNCMSSGVEKIK